MPSNKKRLCVALYPSGVVNNEERKYHWAFLIGPKHEKKAHVPGARYHVKNTPGGWHYEEVSLTNVRSTTNLLGRILVAKIEDEKRLVDLLRRLPVVQGDSSWRCRTWVANALTKIMKDGKCVGTSELDWQKIETTARQFIGEKAINGRYGEDVDMAQPKPTWDMLENRETVV